MDEIDVRMAVWKDAAHVMACGGIISSCFLLGEGVLIGSNSLDLPSSFGTFTHAPRHWQVPALAYGVVLFVRASGVLVLVSAILPFCCSGAFDIGRQESDSGRKESGAAADHEQADKEDVDVVGVVCIDIGPLICLYRLSGEQVHPEFYSSRTHVVVRSERLAL